MTYIVDDLFLQIEVKYLGETDDRSEAEIVRLLPHVRFVPATDSCAATKREGP
jgi:hypothetical protein